MTLQTSSMRYRVYRKEMKRKGTAVLLQYSHLQNNIYESNEMNSTPSVS